MIIISHRELDTELVTAAKSLMYAAGRIDAPELDRVKEQLEAKYGREFGEVNSEVGKTAVDPSLLVKLSIRSPDPRLITQYLFAIAQIFGVEWAPPIEPILDEPVPEKPAIPTMSRPSVSVATSVDPPPYTPPLTQLPSSSSSPPPPPPTEATPLSSNVNPFRLVNIILVGQ